MTVDGENLSAGGRARALKLSALLLRTPVTRSPGRTLSFLDMDSSTSPRGGHMTVWRRWWWDRAWALLLLAALAGMGGSSAWAQGRPRIDGFDVERVAELVPGTRLNFSVFGSPGAQVVLQIDGARRPLPLHELQAGVYDGSYVLDPGERIAPGARVIATLRLDGLETRAALDEPLLLGEAPLPAARPVDALPPMPAPSAEPGRAHGTRPAPAPAPTAPPAPATVPSASPSPVPSPWPTDTRPIPAPATDHPALPQAATEQPAPAPRRDLPSCPDCAIVESIRPLPAGERPPTSVPGTLLGGLFGERVGQAVDRHVARVSGAVERAVHGRPLDERAGPGAEVVLRLPNGQRLLRVYDHAPDLRVGDSVRRSNDLGGARSERMLGAPPPAPPRGPAPRGDQLAGSQPP
jgi:uncharacterized protein YcfJ